MPRGTVQHSFHILVFLQVRISRPPFVLCSPSRGSRPFSSTVGGLLAPKGSTHGDHQPDVPPSASSRPSFAAVQAVQGGERTDALVPTRVALDWKETPFLTLKEVYVTSQSGKHQRLCSLLGGMKTPLYCLKDTSTNFLQLYCFRQQNIGLSDTFAHLQRWEEKLELFIHLLEHGPFSHLWWESVFTKSAYG